MDRLQELLMYMDRLIKIGENIHLSLDVNRRMLLVADEIEKELGVKE